MQNVLKTYNLEKLLLGIVLASAFAEVGLSFSKIYLYHVCIVLLLFYFFLKILINPHQFKYAIPNTLFWALVSITIFYIWNLISLFWTNETGAGLAHVAQLSVSLTGFYIAAFCARDLNAFVAILRIIAIVLIIDATVGFAETLTSFRWPISAYSATAENFGYDAIYLSRKDNWLATVTSRPTGFHWNTNNFAVVIAGASIFYFVLAGRIGKIIALIGGLFLVTSTDSKIVIIIFSLVILMLLVKASMASAVRIVFSVLVTGILVIAIFSLQPSSNQVADYIVKGVKKTVGPVAAFIQTTITDSEDSVSIRKKLYANSIKGAIESSLLGVGVGGSRTYHAQELRGIRIVRTHNYPLEIFLELGLLGLLLFVLFLSITIYWGYIVYKNLPYSNAKNVQKAFIMVFPIALFSMLSISSTAYFLPFWIYMGLLLCVSKINFLSLKNFLERKQ